MFIKNKKIYIRALSLVLMILLMLSSFVSCVDRPHLEGGDEQDSAMYDKLELIDSLFKTYSLFEMDEEALMNAVLKGYVEGTGDRYAEYFTAEEYEQFTSENRGETVGIGINVIQNTEYNCIEVLNVLPDSPALEAGLLPGDLITAIGKGDKKQFVETVGYTKALDLLVGEAGSTAEFTVTRISGDTTEEMEFSIVRRKVVYASVMSHVCEIDKTVGIVKITEFNITTPLQFSAAVDELLGKGCDKFIFDVRYNPGGDLKSIKAVLSYFLDDGDVYIRVSDRSGTVNTESIKPETYKGNYADCSVSKEDIGKYKDLNFAVLTNGSTASAAELFTSALMDYELSVTVGTSTYGKGTMQSTYSLKSFGYEGALKLTTKYYYPPISGSYDGKGIEPDVPVELDESLKDKNIYTITDAEDNQIGKAIEELYKRSKNKTD